MKTEQELKDALEDIFFDALTDKSNPPYYTDKVDPENDGYWQWKVYELCADELIKRGYGDVSEYKSEIERLNSHNGFLQSVISHSKDMLDEAVKQAQIDVLNQLKERAIGYTFLGEKLATETDIDELIKEVQNGEDKS